MWAYKIWLIKFLIICSINANIVSSLRFQLKLQLIELRIYKSLYKTCMYMYIHIFLIVCYIKNLKFSILKFFKLKYIRDPQIFVLLLSLATYKKHVQQFSSVHNSRQGPLWPIIVQYSSIFTNLDNKHFLSPLVPPWFYWLFL